MRNRLAAKIEKIRCSVFWKETYSGKYIHFSSFMAINLKGNSIYNMVFCASDVSSTDTLEAYFSHPRILFRENSYPGCLLKKCETNRWEANDTICCEETGFHELVLHMWPCIRSDYANTKAYSRTGQSDYNFALFISNFSFIQIRQMISCRCQPNLRSFVDSGGFVAQPILAVWLGNLPLGFVNVFHDG